VQRFTRLLVAIALTAIIALSASRLTPISAAVPRASSQVTVFVEPGASLTPVLSLIRSAQHSIRLEVYLLTNHTVVSELQKAVQRHVDVRVMLEKHPFGGARYATLGYKDLQDAHVPVKWGNEAAYVYTHEKAMVVDGRVAGIFTFNLTGSGLNSNREFGVIENNPADAAALGTIFDADWNRTKLHFSSPRLVISPYNSRADFTTLIDGAHHTLDVYAEEVNDVAIERRLIAAHQRGVRVRLITSAQSPGLDFIRRGGVAVLLQAHPYVHAKSIVADGRGLYIGSENISRTSLDSNREAGILLNDPALAGIVERTFAGDWSGVSAGPPPSTTPTARSGSHGLSVRVSTSPSSVSKGQNLTINATTSPGASCAVKVTYPDGYVSRSSALKTTRTANSSGHVSWSWREGSTKAGTAHAAVACSLNGASATGSTTFKIT
jgi:phosphatidylserine/phosphatidylglycerophosphate/cardiolipin synthase-like enzyme